MAADDGKVAAADGGDELGFLLLELLDEGPERRELFDAVANEYPLVSVEVAEKAAAIFEGEGMKTADGSRQRTAGGIFFFLLRRHQDVDNKLLNRIDRKIKEKQKEADREARRKKRLERKSQSQAKASGETLASLTRKRAREGGHVRTDGREPLRDKNFKRQRLGDRAGQGRSHFHGRVERGEDESVGRGGNMQGAGKRNEGRLSR